MSHTYARIALALSAMAATQAFAAQSVTHAELTSNPIVAQAKADLTPRGTAWAKAEGQRVRTGEIQPFQVEQDAASVTGGIVPGASQDDLVLIALIDARGSGEAGSHDIAVADKEGATRRASLEQSIGNVIVTLKDTQRAGRAKLPRPR
jgi:hypothetical protein